MISKLQFILGNLLIQAESTPGVKSSTHLPNGLKVDVLVTTEKTHLQISRVLVFPSDTEWHTILKNWPYPMASVAPKHIESESSFRYYLKSAWPSQMRLKI
ncbi:hypothetical protein LCGC14_0761820 [marine sediment metagenome]|uniref:Uncharacterized protein n=1 Tax=marine sediment metagenome TaxID=412755 RepID=A0A0F9QKU0_9ZZZZ